MLVSYIYTHRYAATIVAVQPRQSLWQDEQRKWKYTRRRLKRGRSDMEVPIEELFEDHIKQVNHATVCA